MTNAKSIETRLPLSITLPHADPEIGVIIECIALLEALDIVTRARVLDYLRSRFPSVAIDSHKKVEDAA